MSVDLVKRYVVNYRSSEGFRYGFGVAELTGSYVTEEVSAGQHSYDHEEFRTTDGKLYATYEVYETEELAIAEGLRCLDLSVQRLKRLLGLFDPMDLA